MQNYSNIKASKLNKSQLSRINLHKHKLLSQESEVKKYLLWKK